MYLGKLNETFTVAAMHNCDYMDEKDLIESSTWWKQSLFGCKTLKILQEIYGFNVEYLFVGNNEEMISEVDAFYNNNYSADDFDILLRPLHMGLGVLDFLYPTHSLLKWNFGFILRRPEKSEFFRTFYSRPFTKCVWGVVFALGFLFSILFYALGLWEMKILKGASIRPSIPYELLIVIGGYCQHIPPLETVLPSRRAVYIIFLLFAYVLYTYYTSNLLSHIVNDTDDDVDIMQLLSSGMECLALPDIRAQMEHDQLDTDNQFWFNFSKSFKKLFAITKPVQLHEGLIAVKDSKAALLIDYLVIGPLITQVFQKYDICDLVQVSVVKNLPPKYFFVSKKFKYRELFRVAVLRMGEIGIASKMLDDWNLSKNDDRCSQTHTVADFEQISSLLTVLLCAYALSVVILLFEIVHYKRNRLWPYVE